VRTKKGRRTAGHDAVATIRLSSELRESVDAWAAKQSDKPARPEAILRLVELGLERTHRRESAPNRAAKASEMAAQEIDRITDPSATGKNANFASGDLSKDRKSSETSARNRVKIDSDGPIFSQWGSSHSPQTRTPPESEVAGGVSGTLIWCGVRRAMLQGLRCGKRTGALEVPHGASGTKSPRRVAAMSAGDLDGFGPDIREPAAGLTLEPAARLDSSQFAYSLPLCAAWRQAHIKRRACSTFFVIAAGLIFHNRLDLLGGVWRQND